MPGGFSNSSSESVLYANNVDFRGVSPVSGQVTANGQLLIGNASDPNIRVGNLVGDSTISVTYSAPNINLHVTGLGADVPKFMAYKSAASSNVTGDNTTYNVVCDTVQINDTSSYNGATGIFTVPSSGLYTFSFSLFTFGISIDTPNHTNFNYGFNCSNSARNNNLIINSYWTADWVDPRQLVVSHTNSIYMLAGEQMNPFVNVQSGPKTISVNGHATNLLTTFSGYKVQ